MAAAAIALRLSSLDALRVARGHCLSCEWCPRFLSPSKRILCDYCGCPPAKHQRLDNDNQKGSSSSSSGGGSKKIKLTDKASSSGTPSSEDEDEDNLDAAEMEAPPSPPSTEDEEVETVKAVKAPRGRKKRLASSADG